MVRHLHLSVRGALALSEPTLRKFAPSVIVDGKPLKTAKQLRDFLLDQLAQGHEVLPCGECDNFDWVKGCLGHSNNAAPPERDGTNH